MRCPPPALTLRPVLALLWLTSACGPADALREYFREPSPHEAYHLGLAQAGLASTALGQDWIRSAQEALARPLAVDAPYQEEGYFPAEEAPALGYRLPLRRGQRLEVRVEVDGAEPARIFLDLFRAAPDSLRAPARVLSGEAGAGMVFEPRRSGDYLLRLQPELLRGGRFRVTILKEPALEFPVAGRTSSAILSFFGAARDGGRRLHHGVDVFAPRGTPALAAAEATVTRVDTTPVGGRVVWLRDGRRGLSLYYAHLDETLVRDGMRVRAGDTIGLVGNTGNARTTAPHLHFGIYARGEGPLDPWDFIRELPPSEPAPVQVALAGLGGWVRTGGNGVHLRDRPSLGAPVGAELPPHTPVRVMGGVGPWYRVRLPDGGSGFVAGRVTEALDPPLRVERVAESRALRAAPLPGSPVMGEVPDGADMAVLGAFSDYLYVQGPGPRAGWVAVARGQE